MFTSDFVASKIGSIVPSEPDWEIGQVQVNCNKYDSTLSHLWQFIETKGMSWEISGYVLKFFFTLYV